MDSQPAAGEMGRLRYLREWEFLALALVTATIYCAVDDTANSR